MKSINLKENQFIQFHQKISFKFDGVKYFGFKGDTIASALLRNNINLVGRSFKSVSYTHLTLPTNSGV